MAGPQPLEISITPHEVVLGEQALEVRAQTAIDPQSARAALALTAGAGTVTMSDDRRAATLVPDGGLTPGQHVLVVGEVVSAAGERLSDRIEVPFFVSDSIAKVDPAHRIESIARLRLEPLGTTRVSAASRPQGSYIELMKAVDRSSGEPRALAFDHEGNAVDADALLAGIEANRRAEFGKLHPTLKRALDEHRSDEPVHVAVWLKLPEERLPDKSARRATARMAKSEAAHRKAIAVAAQRMTGLLRDHGADEPRRDEHAPVVFAQLPAERVRELERHDEVAALFLYDPTGEVDLKDSMQIAQSDTTQSTLGLTGKGVNVAVYEDGPDVTTNLSIAGRFLSNPATSDHSRHTHGIIKNVEAGKPHGHAAGCNLFSANSMDLAALTWAVQQGCTVISQSFHRDAEQTDADLSFDDKFKDWLVLHFPYPTILQAAGNGSSSEFVNHKGFNSLAVGSHDDTAGAMAGDSVFRNASSPHGDRESPEIAANGTGVTTVGLTKSGTSMAAPAAAGCAALLQEADATLKSWPEGCRAILLAGASRNVTGSTWWADRSAGVDARDGSGAVNALESARIAKSRRARNAAAAQRGWDVGTLRSADIGAGGETTFTYAVRVPRLIFGPRVKVALAWDSLATVIDLPFLQFALDTLQLDLDLKIYDSAGALVGYSGSWDNSYEIAEFAARPGATYTIKIRRWSGAADVWYGIAWTVQGTSFIRGDLGLQGISAVGG